MKLYVGAWSEGCGGVFAVDAGGSTCALTDGGAADVRRMALAILVDHFRDAGRAQALCDRFERRLGARLGRSFWTVRESEVAEVIALIEQGDHPA